MIVAAIILILLVFFMLCGLASVTNQLNVVIKNQTEIIRVLKEK